VLAAAPALVLNACGLNSRFWVFAGGLTNVKLNACGLNSKYWVFAGGLTNVNVVLTVRDTVTGTVKTYTNSINTAFQPIQDTSAFSSCP